LPSSVTVARLYKCAALMGAGGYTVEAAAVGSTLMTTLLGQPSWHLYNNREGKGAAATATRTTTKRHTIWFREHGEHVLKLGSTIGWSAFSIGAYNWTATLRNYIALHECSAMSFWGKSLPSTL